MALAKPVNDEKEALAMTGFANGQATTNIVTDYQQNQLALNKIENRYSLDCHWIFFRDTLTCFEFRRSSIKSKEKNESGEISSLDECNKGVPNFNNCGCKKSKSNPKCLVCNPKNPMRKLNEEDYNIIAEQEFYRGTLCFTNLTAQQRDVRTPNNGSRYRSLNRANPAMIKRPTSASTNSYVIKNKLVGRPLS